MKNDLISRQAAIDALDEIESEIADGYGYQYEKWRKYFCGLPSAQPDLDEWCTDCSEYDQERHCCPRWNRVIRQTLKDAQPERKTGEWIPCSERLPDADDCPMDCMVTRKSKFVGNYVDMAVCEKNGTWTHEDWKAITIDGNATCISTRDADIIAWMPLPEPWKEKPNEIH